MKIYQNRPCGPVILGGFMKNKSIFTLAALALTSTMTQPMQRVTRSVNVKVMAPAMARNCSTQGRKPKEKTQQEQFDEMFGRLKEINDEQKRQDFGMQIIIFLTGLTASSSLFNNFQNAQEKRK